MKKRFIRIIYMLAALGIAAILVIAFWPAPLAVEVAEARRAPLSMTVDDEGETRAHDRFVIAAPVAGRIERIELHDGDAVKSGQLVALIHPLPLDVREVRELKARVQTAEALSREAEQQARHQQSDYEQARRERERVERLAKAGIISVQSLEQARNAETTAANDAEAARAKAQAAVSDVKVATAGLVAVEESSGDSERIIRLRAPAAGYVLRITEKSERVVTPGTPILTMGDPSKFEVVIDVLSTDAVKVTPGASILLEGWGGDRPIRARVRTVEPEAFTKVSALGIEEKRVNIVGDFVDSPGPLGDGYRVQARIIIWESEKVLQVPASALFRRGQDWNVFLVQGGRARHRQVQVGHRNPLQAEILAGVQEGDQVILHPTNQIDDGSPVKSR
jgi:HlyD family secretion protein